MTQITFYGDRLANFKYRRLPGALIVLEGTDGVGDAAPECLSRHRSEAHGVAHQYSRSSDDIQGDQRTNSRFHSDSSSRHHWACR